jgi:hypothetical protein
VAMGITTSRSMFEAPGVSCCVSPGLSAEQLSEPLLR